MLNIADRLFMCYSKTLIDGLYDVWSGDWKVSELESVRIGKCQNWKVSEWKSVRVGKCHNRKMSELESVRILRFFKYGANDAYVTIVMQTMA